jgi:hypothetical protein
MLSLCSCWARTINMNKYNSMWIALGQFTCWNLNNEDKTFSESGMLQISCLNPTVFFFFFSPVLGFELGFVLGRQVLCHLSHASSSFCSDYFGDRSSLFAQAGLDHDSPVFCFLLWWDDWHMPPCPVFFQWHGVLQTLFWLRLAWNHNPPDLNLPRSLGWQEGTTIPS